MPQLNIKCGCETAPKIKVMVLTGVVPIAQIICERCDFSYVSVGGEVVNA
jgi:hypothetical protein